MFDWSHSINAIVMPVTINLTRFAQIKATGHLPSPRGVALAVMRMAQDESASLGDMARVIKGDPAFVGRLIKAANGMLLRQRAIVSVQEALMVVGLPAVRSMALGFSLLSNYRKGACPGFDYMRFWASSLIMAIAMQVLCGRTRIGATDELFSVGLLARIGELALATVYPAKYGRLLIEAARVPDADFMALERQALAMTHAELGMTMLVDWGIPAVYTGPVRYYERPEEAPFTGAEGRETGVMQSLILARHVADICLGNLDGQQPLMDKALRLAAHLGCAREDFVNDCNEIVRLWAEWNKMLQLGIDQELPLFETLSRRDAEKTITGLESRLPGVGIETKPPVSPPPDLRAMLVEGNPLECTRLVQALSDIGVQPFECPGLNSVMEQVLDVQPHMLVLGGNDDPARVALLIKTLRSSRIGRNIYILLLLSSDDESHMTTIEAGVDDFFFKPAGMRMLLARLNAARRIVQLYQDLEHERLELRHFAADLAISNRCLQEAALSDALTGLPNRRYAHERIQQEWSAAYRSARALACMVIDIDDFKQINDVYGHDVGDMVLRHTADALRQALRTQDVICRTGGDEFLVICPETSIEEVLSCGERLRKEIDCLALNNESDVLHLSVSVGVAVRDETMSSAGDLIKRADRAVFLAKRRGRNRVVSSADGETTLGGGTTV
jgi:diguanylate cyclase (GGDEF)-like protein